MKKLFLPFIFLVAIALLVAKFFFNIDVEGLFEGFLDFLGELLDGPG